MSVIAWDGKTLAADRQCTNNGLKYEAIKIWQLETGEVVAVCGHMDSGLAMKHWFITGADPQQWPKVQEDNDRWSRLIVLRPNGELYQYERCPYPERIIASRLAWGAGADYAMGAMAMGADARRAVEITNEHSEGCGFGVDAYDVQHLTLVQAGD